MALKIDPPLTDEYREAAIRVAFDFAPRIYPCGKCGWPVANGYCCKTCGDTNPSRKNEVPA